MVSLTIVRKDNQVVCVDAHFTETCKHFRLDVITVFGGFPKDGDDWSQALSMDVELVASEHDCVLLVLAQVRNHTTI